MYASVAPHGYVSNLARVNEYTHPRWSTNAFRPVRNFDPYGTRRTVAPRVKRSTAQIAAQLPTVRIVAPRTVARSHHASAFAFLPTLNMVEK